MMVDNTFLFLVIPFLWLFFVDARLRATRTVASIESIGANAKETPFIMVLPVLWIRIYFFWIRILL
jgi:hypothetical protein